MKDFSKLSAWLERQVSSQKVAGASAAVVTEEEVIFREDVGFADRGKAIPITKNSVYRLASMTKPVTAVSVLLCVRDGLLDMRSPVREFIPGFADIQLGKKTERGIESVGSAKNTMLVKHLLTHTSGLGCGATGDAEFALFCPRGKMTLKEAAEGYAHTHLEFEPGTAQFYSPVFAFDVAARIVEIVSGMPYERFVKERIFQPLGMATASYRLSDYGAGQCVLTYRSEDGVLQAAGLKHNFAEFPEGYTGGGAGLIASTEDYCRFARELLAAYYGRGKILDENSVREMALPQVPPGTAGVDEYFNWGYGVRCVSAKSAAQPLSPGSFGWSGAYGTHFWVDPALGYTAVYMHNSDTFGGSGAPHTVEFEREVMDVMSR